jgi:protein-tyrosine phosphatase
MMRPAAIRPITDFSQLIDLHCHFLPGIDDGAQTLAETLDLARAAVAAGITTSVMTPHVHAGRYDNTLPSITKGVIALQKILDHQKIPLQVRVGGEVRISPDIMRLAEEDQLPFIGSYSGARVVLLEFPHDHLVPGTDKLVEWLIGRGVRPMIAHPERNKEVMRNVAKLEPYAQAGCLFQLTGASIAGLFGEPALNCARALVEREWVTAVATDAHNLKHRPPNLDVARAALVALGGEAYAQRLTCDTPGEIVSGNRAHRASCRPSD